MFGAVTKYLFEYILGIRQAENSVGYKNIVITPVCLDNLDFAKGKINTIKGNISVEYKENKAFIEIPDNVNAVFRLGNTETELKTGKNTIQI